MTNVDEALKQFASDSGAAAGDADVVDVMLRARRSHRAAATRAMTAIGVAAAVAAVTTIALLVSRHDPRALSSPQLGHATATAATTCRPASTVPVTSGTTDAIDGAFVDHCLVVPLALQGLGTVSPTTDRPPDGSLEAAEELLETSAFYTYAPGVETGATGTVGEVLAGYASVPRHSGHSISGPAVVDAWVLAWRDTGVVVHCPAMTVAPRAGAPDEWHFLVVPIGGEPPSILDAEHVRCGTTQAATVETVFRHMRPLVDGAGNYSAYDCPPSVIGDTGSAGGSSDGTTQTADIVVGVPVDAAVCAPTSRHVADFAAGTVVLGPPGEMRGWPPGVPRP